MQRKVSLYIHLVWHTWDNLPLITPTIERRLHRNLESIARKAGCTVLAINGNADHVHLLVILPTTLTIAQLMKQIKGVSARFVNNELDLQEVFKWQGGYGAFSVSRWDVQKITTYIQNQKEHHQTSDLWAELEQTTVVGHD
jgi:REP element-mobilizing transposase RayT